MKLKILSIALAVIMTMTIFAGLTVTSDAAIKHLATHKTAIKRNASYHWLKCTTKNCKYESKKSAHKFSRYAKFDYAYCQRECTAKLNGKKCGYKQKRLHMPKDGTLKVIWCESASPNAIKRFSAKCCLCGKEIVFRGKLLNYKKKCGKGAKIPAGVRCSQPTAKDFYKLPVL